eukprot:m.107765 g.107765  ORF g.107765 m.107765 type:complete len:151 (+) comp15318_c0_seq8:613-1065(+)
MLCFWYVPCFRMDSIVCSVFQSSMGFYRKSVAQVPSETHVLPVINCSHSVNLGCQLLDGSKILGQNNISHPGKTVIKEGQQPALAAPIQRIFYINDWQQEIVQRVDDEVVTDLLASKSVCYMTCKVMDLSQRPVRLSMQWVLYTPHWGLL